MEQNQLMYCCDAQIVSTCCLNAGSIPTKLINLLEHHDVLVVRHSL